LDELAAVSPIQNPREEPICHLQTLEQVRSRHEESVQEQRLSRRLSARRYPEQKKSREAKFEVSRLLTQLYTVSYLILFSILGTLARLGLQALTTYPGTPIIFSSIWPNFAGSLVMGFLSEDRMLFREVLAPPEQRRDKPDEESGGSPSNSPATPLKPPTAVTKKTIPLYIGLATGFCGSLTSFSAFIRDVFLAMSNDLPSTTDSPTRTNGAYSFLALLSIPITTISLSLSGLFLGAHLAIVLASLLPSIPAWLTRRVLNRLAVLLGWGCWLGAVLLSIWPPDRADQTPSPDSSSSWRGAATLALVFAPLGCLMRFFVSLKLNGRVASFPVGTFVVNMLGTAVLAVAWDLAHLPAGGVMVACQVLKGAVQDGFCGCLTTVSTWVAELAALRRRHAYVYGGASVLGGFAVAVAVMGGVRWNGEFQGAVCG
jgi:fluoride ion exporter CrcB/FEX